MCGVPGTRYDAQGERMSTSDQVRPDEAALRRDLQGAAFLVGEAEGRWCLLDPPGIRFPEVFMSVSAAKRDRSPDSFCFRIECTGYPSSAPTSMLWDSQAGRQLALNQYPKGGGDVDKVFRTNWPDEAKGSCL